jgi:hypothetical protein
VGVQNSIENLCVLVAGSAEQATNCLATTSNELKGERAM